MQRSLYLGTLLFLITSIAALSQETPHPLEGTWDGTLDVGSHSLRLSLELEHDGDLWTASIVSIDQGGAVVPVSSATLTNQRIELQLNAVGASFSGTLDDQGSLSGTWSQGGSEFPLTWTRAAEAYAPQARPQDPTGEMPYRSLELELEGPGGVLAGTLTLPMAPATAPYPWVILFSGSGPQDRDEALFGHRPFLVLADALTREGLAVFRFDDRGAGESEGDVATATTEDFVADGRALIEQLIVRAELDPRRIGLIGHSEGALIAAKLAGEGLAQAIVSIAGPALPGSQIITDQVVDISRAMGMPEAQLGEARANQESLLKIALSDLEVPEARVQLIARFAELTGLSPAEVEARFATQIDPILTPWFRYFIRLDPRDWWQKVDVPVLALLGGKDLQVSAKTNGPEFERVLTQAQNSRVQVLPGLNHLMQTAETGLLTEYSEIEETMAPFVLRTISEFLLDALATGPKTAE